MKKSNKNMNFIGLACLGMLLLPSVLMAQRNDSDEVEICNQGDVVLDYVAYATKTSFLMGAEARVSGWYKIKPGDCEDVNLRGYETVALGFLQSNSEGIRGNSVYRVPDATEAGGADWAPGAICVPRYDKVEYDNSTGIVADKFRPPCTDGYAELQLSFAVRPNDVFPTFNLSPHSNDRLVPWLRETTEVVAPSTQNTSSEMSNTEILARVLLGAAKGLEDANVRKLSASCESSILVFAFTFSKEGPAAACRCLSQQIIRSEPSNVVSEIISKIDAGENYDIALENLSEENFEKYLGSCVTSTRSSKATPVKKPELTLVQQALVRFPDPSNVFYKGEPEFNDSENTRRIQGYMTRWEQLSGRNFLADHWSMQPLQGRNKHGVLTRATTLFGVWPNIHAAYAAAEETILNNYKTKWFRVATTAQMQQCIKPPEPKRPQACNDPDRLFLIAECFESLDWQEPTWCNHGYDRNHYMTTINTTERGKHIISGTCLVPADRYGSTLIETRNNGKEIRGYFYSDSLQKNPYVSVECGPVWRDFATAVYNARTDQDFIAANPLKVIVANLNVKAAYDQAAYDTQMENVKYLRLNWIAAQGSK